MYLYIALLTTSCCTPLNIILLTSFLTEMSNKEEWILKISSVFGTFPSKDKAKCKVCIFLKVFSNYKNQIKKILSHVYIINIRFIKLKYI